MASSIQQLAARKAKLEADLAKVNAEIKARAGETDEPKAVRVPRDPNSRPSEFGPDPAQTEKSK